MKIIINFKEFIYLIIAILFFQSCDQSLEEVVFDEVASSNFYQNDEDAILGGNTVYAVLRGGAQVTDLNEPWGFFSANGIYTYNENVTDEVYSAKWSDPGSDSYRLENYQLTANESVWTNQFYRHLFHGIFIANTVLANVENNDKLSESIRNRTTGEALFGRALFYYHAFSLYGNIPLINGLVTDPYFLPMQSSKENVSTLIISDLLRASELLPETYAAEDYGRFSKGAALTLLTRFYANQKNWELTVSTARKVVGMYSLSNSFESIFSPSNTSNPEIILSLVSIPESGMGNTFFASTAEPDYLDGAWGGQRIRNAFYDTFDPQDNRRSFLINSYTDLTGNVKTLDEGYMIMKYGADQSRTGPWAGNDIVILRYADVLLLLAEALNELEGPNSESIDLINQLRTRAFDGDQDKLLKLGDFTKDLLRDHILAERGWELYAEGHRREDLIRHGKLISNAQARGITNAQDYHVLYPIHQNEIDLNPNLIQNPGY